MHTESCAPLYETETELLRRKYPEETVCLIDTAALAARYRLFAEYFLPAHVRTRVSYAVKANPHPIVLNTLAEAGIQYLDCASIGEIRHVLQHNSEARPYFNHPIKRRTDIAQALEMGVTSFTVQDKDEIQRILSLAWEDDVEIVVRLATPETGAGIDLSSKFGASFSETKMLLEYLWHVHPRAKRGIAVHVGSQMGNVDAYRAITPLITSLHQQYKFNSINLGGGFPARHLPGEDYDIEAFVQELSGIVEHDCAAALHDGTEMIIEPGRGMVAESVDMYIPVLKKARRNGNPCIYIYDGVFASFTDHVVHDWPYYFDIVKEDGIASAATRLPHTIFGRTCDSGDVMRDVFLPEDVETGDYLRVRHAGAYMDAQTTFFNGFPLPTYVPKHTI